MSRKRPSEEELKWRSYVASLQPRQQYDLLLVAIERLIETEEVSYRAADPEEDINEELYWDSCGESLLKDKDDDDPLSV